jgi:CheY-like chemotaxis protein
MTSFHSRRHYPAYQLLNRSFREHVMLLCNNQDEYDSAAIDSLNEGLRARQLCIYASVFNGDKSHLSKISSRIMNYQENIEKGNLVIIDFLPFYESAKASNLAPFKHLKVGIEELLRKRISEGEGDKVLIFADAAGFLSEHCHFDKSIELESWWDDTRFDWLKNKQLNITIICPHPAAVLNKESNLYAKSQIGNVHSLMVELQKCRLRNCNALRVLVVEPENDIQTVYYAYLASVGIDAVIVDDIKKCSELTSSPFDEIFEVIIIDIHLQDSDSSGLELAETIKNTKPDQRIVLTTTSPLTEISSKVTSIGIDKEDVLVKPFTLSTLTSLIRARMQ